MNWQEQVACASTAQTPGTQTKRKHPYYLCQHSPVFLYKTRNKKRSFAVKCAGNSEIKEKKILLHSHTRKYFSQTRSSTSCSRSTGGKKEDTRRALHLAWGRLQREGSRGLPEGSPCPGCSVPPHARKFTAGRAGAPGRARRQRLAVPAGSARPCPPGAASHGVLRAAAAGSVPAPPAAAPAPHPACGRRRGCEEPQVRQGAAPTSPARTGDSP